MILALLNAAGSALEIWIMNDQFNFLRIPGQRDDGPPEGEGLEGGTCQMSIFSGNQTTKKMMIVHCTTIKDRRLYFSSGECMN